jgi:hypothetical protein
MIGPFWLPPVVPQLIEPQTPALEVIEEDEPLEGGWLGA